MRPIVGRVAGLIPVDFGPVGDHALLALRHAAKPSNNYMIAVRASGSAKSALLGASMPSIMLDMILGIVMS
jgi:hypothetical protein